MKVYVCDDYEIPRVGIALILEAQKINVVGRGAAGGDDEPGPGTEAGCGGDPGLAGTPVGDEDGVPETAARRRS